MFKHNHFTTNSDVMNYNLNARSFAVLAYIYTILDNLVSGINLRCIK